MNSRNMLTTSDNPYNPWTDFDDWDNWDRRAGYNTLAYLARVTWTSDELSSTDQLAAMQQGMDDVIAQNNELYSLVPAPPVPPIQSD